MTEPSNHDPTATEQDVIEEGMQGATGEVDANGLEKNFDRKEKLDELQDNLQDLTRGTTGEEQQGNA
ncbi:hypothetical protein [Deinococcus sp. YIM 77859]|uniref:hypothetical protein n=1 Tax=Deinococcus sp. YIM 77859 TaxID=1540221 RepID=UPI000559377F|nr:hypothetical protein [Deinococcus sp. YIM 77859]